MQNVVKAPTCPEWISSLHKAFLQNGFNHTASALIDDGGMDPSKVEAAFEEICRVVDIHRKKKGLGKKKSAWDLYTKLEGNGAPASPSESSEAESSEEEDESSSESDSDSTSNKKAAVKLNNVLQVAKAKPKAESESESESGSGSGSESKSDSESESESNSESSSSEDDVQKDAHRHREQLRGKQAKKSEKNVPTPASSSSESSSSSSEESSGSEEDDSSQSSSDESVELKRPGLGSGIGNIPKVTTKARDKTAGSGKAQTASSASADSSESEDSENSESTGSDSDSSSDSDSVKSSDSDSSSSDSDSSEDDSSSPESGTEEEKRAARRRSGVVQNLAAKLQNVTPSPKNALNKSKREKRKSQDRSDVSSDDVVKEDKIGGKENTSTEVQFPRSEQKRKASSASLDGDAFINNKRRRRNENFNGRFTPSPFKRVREETVVYSDSRLRDNTFYSKNDSFGVRAHNDLIVTRGKGFRKEKTKKKRLNHHGGTLSYQHSFLLQNCSIVRKVIRTLQLSSRPQRTSAQLHNSARHVIEQ
ncbi:unnamed protein product [Chondrus crispus]|uniref:Srp40 C-terminal domain-containing protein n=1 Tax=Chondrus crispus TaxID=2769 RepID=R7QJ02_CHOCR|nr:unnamed protein product [Chondrus crispus]CDF37451.1 unnamed protein product [Chondrus crispus]|eukprot:XP_005717270.1 unnamed protein product [Chondrus crispus]